MRRNQDRIDRELFGHQRGQQRAGAAERDHAKARRIDAAAREHVGSLRRHHRGRDADRAVRDFLHRAGELRRNRAERVARRRQLQRQLAAQALARFQQTGDQERIGQRRDQRARVP